MRRVSACPRSGYSLHTTITGEINGTQVKTGIIGDNGQCVAKTCLCGKGDKPVVDPVTGACSCQSVCPAGVRVPQRHRSHCGPERLLGMPGKHRGLQGQTGYDLFTFAAYQDQCVPCDPKTERSNPGSATCVPLNCDPKKERGQDHKCVPCQGPGGQCIIGGEPVLPKRPPGLKKKVKAKVLVDETKKL